MSNIIIIFAILAVGCVNAQYVWNNGARAGAIAGTGQFGGTGFPWFRMLTPADIMNMQPKQIPGGNVHRSSMSSISKGGVTQTEIVNEHNGIKKAFKFTN